MLDPLPDIVERGRVTEVRLASDASFQGNGAFQIRHPEIRHMWIFIVSSDGPEWDHVSVSLRRDRRSGTGLAPVLRCPTWEEMCFVKDWFFGPGETVIQYHPPRSEYVNYHPFTLHLWRPHNHPLPRPPTWMIGPKT